MIECFIYYLFYLSIWISKYSKASIKIKKSVNDWRNSFMNKKYLYSSYSQDIC